MNKYQETALKQLGINFDSFGKTISEKTQLGTKELKIENDSILVYADRDIYSKDYTLRLYTGKRVNCELLFGKKWIPQENNIYEYEVRERNTVRKESFRGSEAKINLDNRPEKIKLIIPGGVCDDVILEIKYDIMSEEEYWEVQNSPETLRNNMNVSYRVANSLVNIYWKHAKENVVALVRIDLYVGERGNGQLMAKYKITDEVFFKSIDGLAYGKYYFQLFQFDKDNKQIAATDIIDFEIKKPSSGHYEHAVTI